MHLRPWNCGGGGGGGGASASPGNVLLQSMLLSLMELCPAIPPDPAEKMAAFMVAMLLIFPTLKGA